MKVSTILAAVLFSAIGAQGAISITDATPYVLDFDTDLPGVFRSAAGSSVGGNASIKEPDAWGFNYSNSNRTGGLVSTTAAVQQAFKDGGAPTEFAADADGNGATNNTLSYNGGTLTQGTTESGLSTAVMQLTKAGDYASNGFYLRIQNNTGAPVDSWDIAADMWVSDTDSTFSTLSVGYAVTNGIDPAGMTFTNLTTFTGVNTGGVFAYQTIAGGLDETISATVADGDYFVLSFTDGSENGTTYAMDNLTITAVPEPASLGLLVLGGLAMLKRRRR